MRISTGWGLVSWLLDGCLVYAPAPQEAGVTDRALREEKLNFFSKVWPSHGTKIFVDLQLLIKYRSERNKLFLNINIFHRLLNMFSIPRSREGLSSEEARALPQKREAVGRCLHCWHLASLQGRFHCWPLTETQSETEQTPPQHPQAGKEGAGTWALPHAGIPMPHLKLTGSVTAGFSPVSSSHGTWKNWQLHCSMGNKQQLFWSWARLVKATRRARPVKYYLFVHFHIYTGDALCSLSIFLMIVPGSKEGNETRTSESHWKVPVL